MMEFNPKENHWFNKFIYGDWYKRSDKDIIDMDGNEHVQDAWRYMDGNAAHSYYEDEAPPWSKIKVKFSFSNAPNNWDNSAYFSSDRPNKEHLYSKWIKANKPETIKFEMVSYNTLITKPSKKEIKLYGKS